jgi:hypothetical protein
MSPAELAASADPEAARHGLIRLAENAPAAAERIAEDAALRLAVVTVMATSPFLTRTLVTDSQAIDALADMDRPTPMVAPPEAPGTGRSGPFWPRPTQTWRAGSDWSCSGWPGAT